MTPPLAFTLMCLAWGSTFVALKAVVEFIPPVFLSGVRFLWAAGLILAWFWLRQIPSSVPPSDRWRLVMLSFLSIVLGYGLGFWSITYLTSGLAAVLNFCSVALSILGFSLLLGREKPSSTKLLGIGLGVLGLLLLFAPYIQTNSKQAWAILAMVVGSSMTGLSAVLVRPLAARYPALEVNLFQMLPGGLLLILAGIWEPITPQTLTLLLEPRVALGLAYLVLAGSILGLTLYYYLLAHWPATRVSSYTFVCPIIALLLGRILLHEQISPMELLASGVLLCGAGFTLRETANG